MTERLLSRQGRNLAAVCAARTALLIVAVGGLSLSGCGRSGPKVVPVSGKVTLGGKPIEHLVIHFLPDQGRPSWGYTDADGRFSLEYTRDQDGAVVGRHQVWVIYEPRPKDPGEEMAWMSGGRPKPPSDLAAALQRFGSMETSTLAFEITKAENDLEVKLD